jgi:hypothetical protein
MKGRCLYLPSFYARKIADVVLQRFKAEMWSKVAEELVIPWRAVEAMHWRLGEQEMAQRAGVVPFSSSIPSAEGAPSPVNPASPSRGHSHSQSLSSNISASGSTGSRYNRPTSSQSGSTSMTSRGSGGVSTRSIAARRDNAPRLAPPTSPDDARQFAAIGRGMSIGLGRGGPILPSVAEMTTGVSAYNTAAYAMSMPPGGGYSTPGPLLPSIGTIGVPPIKPEVKMMASPAVGHIPDLGQRETSRRRQ